MDVPEELFKPKFSPIKLRDLMVIMPGNANVRYDLMFGSSNEYRSFHTSQLDQIGTAIIDTIMVEMVFPNLLYTDAGLFPMIVVKGSDRMIFTQTLDMNMIKDLYLNNKENSGGSSMSSSESQGEYHNPDEDQEIERLEL